MYLIFSDEYWVWYREETDQGAMLKELDNLGLVCQAPGTTTTKMHTLKQRSSSTDVNDKGGRFEQ